MNMGTVGLREVESLIKKPMLYNAAIVQIQV